jgi:uncharacterized YccA/Bax inhibitor family protein
MRTSNPVFNEKTFNRYAYLTGTDASNLMTVQGAVNKTILLFLITAASAVAGWVVTARMGQAAYPVVIGAAILALVIALVTGFKAQWSPGTAPVYAIVEGVFLGGFSCILEGFYPGIAFQAVSLTFGVFAAMLVLYKTRVLRATGTFKKCVIAATMGIALVYLISMGMSLFGQRMPFLHDSTPIGIGISLFVIVVAALNFVLDFDLIESGANEGAPKFMEWYAAFALLVTLAWLYVEMLNLLRKLRD